MKDSKQVRSEYQSFVESYSSIAAKGAEEAKEAEMKKKSSRKEKEDDECSCEKESVLMRKSGAFTELAEKYQMSVKQFARFVENNQGLFDVTTRQKAVLANKFSGFKETVEWDQFFGDLELVQVEEGLGVVTGTAKVINKVMKSPSQTPAQEKKAVRDLTKAMDVVAKPIKSFVNVGDKKNQEMMNKRRPTAAQAQRMEEFDAEVEELQEIQTKETASGTKYKVRVKEKESGSSYIRYATREKIAQLRADPKIASVEMTDEGEAPEDKGEKKAQAKGGGLAVKAKKMKEKKEKEAAAPAKPAKRSVTTEGMDPVGQEDADIDNDRDTDKSDEYLHKRRKAIGKAMKKRGTKKESFSNWREELKEITDVQDAKKIKGGKVNNKVVINPPMGEEFDPQKIAEGLGAELVSCEEIIDEQIIGDRTRKVVRDQRQGVHGDADAMKQDMDATKLNLLKMRPYGVKGFPSAKKNDKKTTQVAHYELEGQLISERDDEPGEGPRQRYGDMRGLDRGTGNEVKFGGDFQPGGKYGPPKRPPLKQAKAKSKTQMAHFEPEGEQIDEKKLTEPEMKKREEVVKSMKKKGDFSKYGSRAKEVMYATATKIAKKKA